jgi:hypothetical protein
MIRRAISARAVTRGPSAVEIVLRPGEVGHAVPTGDLFRRLVVGVERVGEDGEIVDFQTRPIGRTFAFEGTHQRQLADTRPGAPGQEESRLSFSLRGRGRTRYWIDYQRIASAQREDADVEQSTRVLDEWIEDSE